VESRRHAALRRRGRTGAAARGRTDLLATGLNPAGIGDLNAEAAARGLVSGGGAPLRFAAAPDDGLNYEIRARDSGLVATRPGNTHDLLNARAWLDFPHTKAALNALHCKQIAMQAGSVRSPVRDALTLFDESGLIVTCDAPALTALLRGFKWKPLFWERRHDVLRAMRFAVLGHALAEKLLAPYKGITAHAMIVDAPLDTPREVLDARIAAALPALTATRELAPLPVLGIPGWTPDNEDPAYYDDNTHFRPGRRG
jgi:hypothetical protein